MMYCVDCGAKSLKQIDFELVCTNCGLVQQEDYLIYEPDLNISEVICSSEEQCGSRIIEDLFKKFDYSEPIIADAAKFFEICGKSSKGIHREALQQACVFFAQRGHADQSKADFILQNTIVCVSHFSKACTEVYEKIGYMVTVKKTDNLRGLIEKLGVGDIQKARLTSLTILDKIKGNDALCGIRDSNIEIGVIYIGCVKCGNTLKTKDVANIFNITHVTLSKVVKLIYSLI